MASLVADYASSDDETPIAAPVARPNQPADDGEVDDDAAEQQARADVFGLKESERVVAPGTVAGRLGGAALGGSVSAAPDVLAEVGMLSPRRIRILTISPAALRQDPNAPTALITRPTDKVMNVNISYDDMMRPTLGPENPFDTRKNKGMNSVAGESAERALQFESLSADNV